MTLDKETRQLHDELQRIAITDDAWDPQYAAHLAGVAIRRWRSFDRRHRTSRPTLDLRVRDLVKGLRQGYPDDPVYIEPGSLERLARRFSELLTSNA